MWPRRAARGVRARWHAETLDRALAEGADAAADPLLAARAAQLIAPRSRRRLAGGLARVRRAARDGQAQAPAAVAIDRHEVRGADRELVTLERRLRDGGAVDPRGAAMVSRLLCDGEGPLHDPVGAGSVARHVRAAVVALGDPPR